MLYWVLLIIYIIIIIIIITLYSEVIFDIYIYICIEYRYSRSAADPDSQDPPASLEEVMEAGRQANAHDFIMSFPDGYQTVVGERGIR